MADAELGVMLEPTNDLKDEVDDQDVQVGPAGGGGDVSAAERDQQEGIVAGGVSKGLAAAGVLTAILSQLKSVGGIINSVFAVASRALLPAIEVIADILRPINEAVNDFITAAGQIAQAVGVPQAIQNVGTAVERGESTLESLTRDPVQTEEDVINRLQNQNQNGIGIFNIDPADTADVTGEGFKTQLRDILESPFRDTLGGGGI
ncbi:hypothetical protein OSG_eHP35_00180 [environmental Halophage eHP-35]|nr:hypothetical protein OSG_eHP35_00180 [environmental Halophage eHP-35]